MKHLLLTTIAAVVLMGCGPSEADRALHTAVIQENTKAVKEHLASGADVNAKDDEGISLLHYAVFNGHKEITELLIAKGADVNGRRVKGGSEWTPLHHAAIYNRKETVEPLVAAGADVNAKDVDGETPLDWAIKLKHPEVAELLRKHGGKTKNELKAEGN